MPSDWSPEEKKIARRVFDAALHRELAEVMQKFKSMAANATEPDDMWSTEEFLTQARKSIDQKYDYRYSQLEFVFVGDRMIIAPPLVMTVEQVDELAGLIRHCLDLTLADLRGRGWV